MHRLKNLSSIALICLLLSADQILAGTAGAPMPWDTGLANVIDNITGTVSRLMILGAVVVSGLMWAITEHNTGARRISQIVFGGSVALSATAFLAALGFSGAVV